MARNYRRYNLSLDEVYMTVLDTLLMQKQQKTQVFEGRSAAIRRLVKEEVERLALELDALSIRKEASTKQQIILKKHLNLRRHFEHLGSLEG